MKILAIDDEELSLQRLQTAILEAAPQAQVYAFRNPLDALECMNHYNIDVAFLDVQLRGKIHGVELAKILKKMNPKINIVFATGFREYMSDAFSIHASGYILKPITAEKVSLELANLRNPVDLYPKKELSVQCFGDFEVFFNGEPVQFHYSKAKELFAYLVDRKGASVTGNAICAALWEENQENRGTKGYLRSLFLDLKTTFTKLGLEDVLIKGWNLYAVRKDAFWCDYYEFEKGNPAAINAFHNEYMSQYSWAEFRLGELIK